MLAASAGRPRAVSAGKVISVPPPASALTAPPATAASPARASPPGSIKPRASLRSRPAQLEGLALQRHGPVVALDHAPEALHGQVLQHLRAAAGPADLDLGDRGRVAEAD